MQMVMRNSMKQMYRQISTVKNELKKIIAALCNSSKVEFDEDDPINQSLLNLAAKDRKLVGHIFDATSRLMSMHKLSLNPFSIEIAKSFMRTELVQIALDKAIESICLEKINTSFPFTKITLMIQVARTDSFLDATAKDKHREWRTNSL